MYGESGDWEAPVTSSLCEDIERCAEWHDDTDGGGGPQTLCCVKEEKLSMNSFDDCRLAFRFTGPRDA